MDTRVDAVIFDMDDVLFDYDFDARMADMAGRIGRTAAEIRSAIFDSGFDALADSGAFDAETYLAGWQSRLGVAVDRADWVAARLGAMRARPAVWALAARVAVPRAVLTNNGPLLRDAVPERYPDLVDLFEGRLCFTCDLPAAKPEAAAFRAVCARLGASPARTAFIDDTPGFVAGARETGLIAHLYRDVAGLEAFLGDLGVLAPDRKAVNGS